MKSTDKWLNKAESGDYNRPTLMGTHMGEGLTLTTDGSRLHWVEVGDGTWAFYPGEKLIKYCIKKALPYPTITLKRADLEELITKAKNGADTQLDQNTDWVGEVKSAIKGWKSQRAAIVMDILTCKVDLDKIADRHGNARATKDAPRGSCAHQNLVTLVATIKGEIRSLEAAHKDPQLIEGQIRGTDVSCPFPRNVNLYFLSEALDGFKAYTINVGGAEEPIVITGTLKSGDKGGALIMPMRP